MLDDMPDEEMDVPEKKGMDYERRGRVYMQR